MAKWQNKHWWCSPVASTGHTQEKKHFLGLGFYGILGPFLWAKFSVWKFGCAKEFTFRRSGHTLHYVTIDYDFWNPERLKLHDWFTSYSHIKLWIANGVCRVVGFHSFYFKNIFHKIFTLKGVLPTFLQLTISPNSIQWPLQGLGCILVKISFPTLHVRSSSKKWSDWWRNLGADSANKGE